MPKLQEFKIEYKTTGQLQVYFPGQTVNGVVKVHLKDAVKAYSICLKAKGAAHVGWTQAKDSVHIDLDGYRHNHNRSRYYRDDVTYMEIEMVLWGNNKNEDAKVLNAGVHEFPFSFQLPSTCPSSFEHSDGYVRYFCKAVVDVPWGFNYTTQNVFTIIDLVDLNKHRNLEAAKSTSKLKTVHGFLGLKKLGDIEYNIILPRTGFVPGEIVPFTVNVTNNSYATVSNATVTLMERVILIADNKHTKLHDRPATKVEKVEEISHGKNLSWRNDSFKLPAIAPSLIGCRVLRIEYFLMLKIHIKGMHMADNALVPIFIGNVPFVSNFNELRGVNNVQNSADSRMTQFDTIYPDLPPPSYAEACFGTVEINPDEQSDTNGSENNNQYTPRYICY